MSRLKYWYKKPSDKTVYMLRNKYLHLRVLIIDEISMIGRRTFGHFYLSLKAVIQNSLPFGGFLCRRGLFLQLSPVNQKVYSVDGC